MSQSSNSRRKFIINSAKGTAALGLGLAGFEPFLSSCSASRKMNLAKTQFNTGFSQTPLPYAYNALENVIDAATMEIHYTKHAAGYATNLKDAAKAEGVDTAKPLEDLLAKISGYSTKMRNNAGGHYNHELFWKCMRPKTNNNLPGGKLLQAIEKDFGSFTSFKTQFSEAAKTRFGSGWAWLLVNENNVLKISSTPNQDNPLMNLSSTQIGVKGFPLLGLDVWEHAYYLKYQNKRADYIENWWQVVNWNYVSERFVG